jgi:DNA-binding NarL/FixJ family response regulator
MIAVRILLIEDQAMFRGLIAAACENALQVETIGQAGTGAAGLELAGKLKPDVILLDLDLPDVYGLEIIGKLMEEAPTAKVVILSAHTEDYVIHRCLKLEVDAFVDKNDEPSEMIVQAIGAVLSDRPFFSAAFGRVKQMLREDPESFTKILSEREQELIGLFGRGFSGEQVGKKLGLSPVTVQNHRRNIMGKLGMHSAVELNRYAIEKGFAPPPRNSVHRQAAAAKSGR